MKFDGIPELIKKIWESEKLSPSLLNEVLELYSGLELLEEREKRTYLKKQMKEIQLDEITEKYKMQKNRLIFATLDKIKQLNYYLDDKIIDKIKTALFYSISDKSKIKDIRIVNKNEIAILRENKIKIGESFLNVDSLDERDEAIQAEAYYRSTARAKSEFDVFIDPKSEFPELYKMVEKNTYKLLISLNLIEKEEFDSSPKDKLTDKPRSKSGHMEVYFNANMSSFREGVEKFTMIVTILPNEIQVYDVRVTENGWVGKRKDQDEFETHFEIANITLLKENPCFAHRKPEAVLKNKIDFDAYTEARIDELRRVPFSSGLLLEIYGPLFDENVGAKSKADIDRLKFIISEKFIQLGHEYLMSLKYAETIFSTIEEFKNQVLDAVRGKNKFPGSSILEKVKQIKPPTTSKS
jgi:hypothetical protein